MSDANLSIDQKISQMESLLASGANTVTIDGVSVSLNVASLRQQIRDLKRLKSHRPQALQVRFANGYDGY